MICAKCQKNPATVHITELANNQKKEVHLCDECARTTGVGMKITLTLNEMFGNFVEAAKAVRGAPEVAVPRCPNCGITYTEFKAKARLGCPNDYEVFKAGLVPLLEKYQGATQHVGKTPATVEASVRLENELVRLKRELDGVVKSENFEKAAQIRDRIKHLEIELKRGA